MTNWLSEEDTVEGPPFFYLVTDKGSYFKFL